MDKRGEGVSCARKLIGIKRTRGKQEQNLWRKWGGGCKKKDKDKGRGGKEKMSKQRRAKKRSGKEGRG